jgi:uncharacterized membrane protein
VRAVNTRDSAISSPGSSGVVSRSPASRESSTTVEPRRRRFRHNRVMDAMPPPAPPYAASAGSLYTWTQIIYGLHALSLVTGILGAASVVGAFLIGWPSIIAVIMNYIKRSEARGTWLDSHFRWQIRTFWFGLAWAALCAVFVVLTLGIGLIFVWIPLGFLAIWFIYRIVRGWMALSAHRPMYA